MLKELIGMALVAVGVSVADAPNLLIPITLVALGFWLMRGMVGTDER